jgi:predicted TIM-barrel fold metal-dependent hydrolase
MAAPEHNVTGIDFGRRAHLRYDGPSLVDFHCHLTRTRGDAPSNTKDTHEKKRAIDQPSLEQAAAMVSVADQFNIDRLVTMCPLEDIEPLRQRFGNRLVFNGSIAKNKADEPDDDVYRLLDAFLAAGVRLLKFWAAPRGRERGLLVDAPWRIEAARRARAAGIGIIMVHVGDPDTWFQTTYADVTKYGTKADQYVGLRRMLEEFTDLTWIGAHMGGDVEHPDHLESLLERYPHLFFDTSATKWQVREASRHRDEVRALMIRHSDRFLFGSDLVTRHSLPLDHYSSRYWCQRTLWESSWTGPSPIADADHRPQSGEGPTPLLRGLDLPLAVLRQVYHGNAERLLSRGD